MKIKIKGFTLTELVIAIAIIIVLSTISVPIYKDYVYNSKITEGYLLLSSIRDAQMRYYNEYGSFLDDNASSFKALGTYTSYESVTGVDARTNKYFKTFNWDFAPNQKGIFTAFVSGAGIILNMLYDLTKGATIY